MSYDIGEQDLHQPLAPPVAESDSYADQPEGVSDQHEGVADDSHITDFEREITKFYQIHNPEKLSQVPTLARKYAQNQDSFWREVRKKYPASLDEKSKKEVYAEFEADVRKFYSVHNPKKLAEVPKIAKKYVSKQDAFWADVYKHYNLNEGSEHETTDRPPKENPAIQLTPAQRPPSARPPAQPLVAPVQVYVAIAPVDQLMHPYPSRLPPLESTNQIKITYVAPIDPCSKFYYGCFTCNPCCYESLVKPRQYLWVMENRIEENQPIVPCICCCCATDRIEVTYFDVSRIRAPFERATCFTPFHFCCCIECCGGVVTSAPYACLNCCLCPCLRTYWPYLRDPESFARAANTAKANLQARQRMR